MADIKSTYSEADYLNEFVKYIPLNSQITISLSPNIPEFLDAKHNGIYTAANSLLEKNVVLQGQKLENKHVRAISLLSLCEKHNIYSFRGLKFGSGFNRFQTPEITYSSTVSLNHYSSELDKIIFGEVSKIALNPTQFSGFKKWYEIWFDEIESKNIQATKEAVGKFLEDNYRIDHLRTELNPNYYTSDHYHDGFESDLSVSMSEGKITVMGNKIPENFEFPNTKEKLREFFGIKTKKLIEN